MFGGVGVIAVGVIGDVASRLFAGVHGLARVSRVVPIRVKIPGGLSGNIRVEVVDEGVAVVILSVTYFWGVQVDRVVIVIAVGVIGDVVGRLFAGVERLVRVSRLVLVPVEIPP